VVDPRNVKAMVVPFGSDGENFTWTYDSRTNMRLHDALGQVLLDGLRAVPEGSGVLAFFPSYASLNTTTKRMRESGLMGEVEAAAFVVEEARDGPAEPLVDAYRKALGQGR